MIRHAVIDTNVLVSALLTRHEDAATLRIMNAVWDGRLIPVCCEEILQEYEEILLRPRFGFARATVLTLLASLRSLALSAMPVDTNEPFADEDDRIFYECAVAAQPLQAFLVTGNLKHYPDKEFILSPKEMLEIM